MFKNTFFGISKERMNGFSGMISLVCSPKCYLAVDFLISIFFTPPSFWKYLSLKYGKNEIIDTWNFFGKFKLIVKIFLKMRCSCFCQSHSHSYVKKWNTKASVFFNEGREGHCFSLSLSSPQDGSIEIERCLGRLADGTSKCLKTIPVYNKESVVLHAVLGYNI